MDTILIFINLLIIIVTIYIYLLLKKDDNIIIESPSIYQLYPRKGSQYSAGWDTHSIESIEISKGKRHLVSTGLFLRYLPNDLYLRVAPRSSLACRGIDIGAGVVDADYRGEIKVLVINNSDENFKIDIGDRIAQLIPEKIATNPLVIKNTDGEEVKCRVGSERGSGGFGSSGK